MRENKRLIRIVAVGAGIVMLFLAYTVFFSGGDDTSSESSVEIPEVVSSATTTTTAPGEPTVPGGEFDVFATRDPFEPVVSVGPPPTTPTTTPGGTTPATGGGTSPTTSVNQNPSGGTSVALLDVFEEGGVVKARIQVGSTVYTVIIGETFATSYRLVSISGTCVQLLYGDAPFQLCEGEAVIK